jgi:hypothetical protein
MKLLIKAAALRVEAAALNVEAAIRDKLVLIPIFLQ